LVAKKKQKCLFVVVLKLILSCKETMQKLTNF